MNYHFIDQIKAISFQSKNSWGILFKKKNLKNPFNKILKIIVKKKFSPRQGLKGPRLDISKDDVKLLILLPHLLSAVITSMNCRYFKYGARDSTKGLMHVG